jgi:hypothetical protein
MAFWSSSYIQLFREDSAYPPDGFIISSITGSNFTCFSKSFNHQFQEERNKILGVFNLAD